MNQPYTDFFIDLKYKSEDIKISELKQYDSYGTLIITSKDKMWANQNSDLNRNVEVTFWYEKPSLINGYRAISVVDIPFKSPLETEFSISIPALEGYKLTHIDIQALTISFHHDSGRQYQFNHPNTIGTYYYYYTEKYATEEEKSKNCWSGYDCKYNYIKTQMTVQINLNDSKKISSLDTFEMYDRTSIKSAAAY